MDEQAHLSALEGDMNAFNRLVLSYQTMNNTATVS